MERDAARLKGERGQLIAATAQAKGRISELRIQILQIDQNLRSDVAKELSDIRAKVAELMEKKVAAEDLLQKLDIRSPQNGTVQDLVVMLAEVRSTRANRSCHCSGGRCAGRRGADPAAGHRSGAAQSGGRAALSKIQPANHTGTERHRDPHRSGLHPR